MRALFGCRRPDKTHYMDEARAQRELAQVAAKFAAEHDDRAQVYRCCDAGWVWGRPGEPLPKV